MCRQWGEKQRIGAPTARQLSLDDCTSISLHVREEYGRSEEDRLHLALANQAGLDRRLRSARDQTSACPGDEPFIRLRA
jgi:hypothetical protein